ncbi:MAG: FAD-dependent oxidoreductase [Candidatus Riflebacteria bacterium]|nr:FAD-dependent oxidoreductase [Candidatus Riflebacteria bacterium]
MVKKVVIIGGVAGGASCAARLRRLDENAEITIFEQGEYISYANCGLPYYVSGVIKEKKSLIVAPEHHMRERFKLDIRSSTEVTSIDRAGKKVFAKELKTGLEYALPYDKLVLSTGALPLRPPIPGIENQRILTVRTIDDVVHIRKIVEENNAKTVAVAGGGFIGLEMAENLAHAGCKVSLLEAAPQVMAPLDFEMAQLLHVELDSNGIDLYLDDPVSRFDSAENAVTAVLKSGTSITADFIILSLGVRPNSKLAQDAGLKLNPKGYIIVDEFMLTSDPDIYAVGDVVEIKDIVTGNKTAIALAGPANKQGRVAANNIAGRRDTYKGAQGTSVLKLFNLTAASTGANERTLKAQSIEYEKAYVTQGSNASYYPGAMPMTMKLLFSPDGERIFGAQIVGQNGVDKRIDILAQAIRLGATVQDLTDFECAYAPPYSSAKDPVNMLAYTAQNIIEGLFKFADWDFYKNDNLNRIILDVHEEVERAFPKIPGAVNVTLGKLRDHLHELDKTKEIVVLCRRGTRAYIAARLLKQHGFENVKSYPGGACLYYSSQYKSKH